MNIITLPIKKLYPHPANANVMNDGFLNKLRRHIEKQGNYEPLVVRPHPTKAKCYQIINGHHRKLVLEQLNYHQAGCVVWDVSDEQALMLLATLNRLTGQDEPLRRAALLEKLQRRFEKELLLKSLPEKRAHLQKILEINKAPQPVDPRKLAEMPQAITFFVNAQQKKIVENALNRCRSLIGGEDPKQKLSRGDLLSAMAHTYLRETK